MQAGASNAAMANMTSIKFCRILSWRTAGGMVVDSIEFEVFKVSGVVLVQIWAKPAFPLRE